MSWQVIASYVILRHRRHRMQWVVLAFVGLLFGAALLFSSLSYGTPYRALVNVGTFGAELLGFMTALFGVVLLITEDLEGRGAILTLSKPIRRSQYLIGWYAGFAGGLFMLLGTMLVFLLLLLWALGGSLETVLLWEFWMIYLKILMTVALALVLAMLVTSLPMALVGLVFVYFLGHFSHQLKELARQVASKQVFWAAWALDTVLPSFHLLEAMDSSIQGAFSFQAALFASFYAAAYIAAALVLSVFLFRKREF